MLRHPALARLRRVQLPLGLTSQYTWRRGDGSFRGACEAGVSSIEAIYHCCRLEGRVSRVARTRAAEHAAASKGTATARAAVGRRKIVGIWQSVHMLRMTAGRPMHASRPLACASRAVVPSWSAQAAGC